MARKRGSLLGFVGGVLATAGIAKVVADLGKAAKETGKDIVDVAAEKASGIVESVKSGELQNTVVDFANKTVEEVKSGELVDKAVNFANKTIEDAKSGELQKKAVQFAGDVKEGIVEFVNSATKADEVVDAEVDVQPGETQPEENPTEE